VAEPFGRDDWSAQRRVVSDGADAAHVGNNLSVFSPLLHAFTFRDFFLYDPIRPFLKDTASRRRVEAVVASSSEYGVIQYPTTMQLFVYSETAS
jgi:hypothetical protein